MTNYTNAKLYLIRNHQTSEVFVGTTVQSLAERKGGFIAEYKNYLKGRGKYKPVFSIVKYSDCYIELVDIISCNSKMELSKREGEYIRSIDCVNKNIIKEKEQEEETKNIIIKEKEKEEETKNIKKKKEKYYKTNKNFILEKHRDYYEENKKEIKDKVRVKYTCVCGCVLTKQCKSRHEKSKTHQTFIINNEQ